MNDIDDLLADLEEQEGVDLIYDALVPRTEHVIEHQYRDADETVCLSLANDGKTPVDYLILTAPDDVLDRMVAFLKTQLPVVSFEDLRTRAHERTESDPGALVRMAIAAEEPDQDSITLIRQALHSPDRDRKHAAIEAACLTGWPLFLDELVDLYHRHPETDTRALAGRAAQALIGRNPTGPSHINQPHADRLCRWGVPGPAFQAIPTPRRVAAQRGGNRSVRFG
ncbi:hypothetical protein AB0L53_44355 [Nonomuraea sp. NPDC052129]|uniref:hypothetical protein n=1 Tax=Nonomuraea sp. NPDC052129 TaxID=3154651 RepID=UPI0034372F8B